MRTKRNITTKYSKNLDLVIKYFQHEYGFPVYISFPKPFQFKSPPTLKSKDKIIKMKLTVDNANLIGAPQRQSKKASKIKHINTENCQKFHKQIME